MYLAWMRMVLKVMAMRERQMVFIQLIYQSNLSTNYTSGGAFWLLIFHSHQRVEKTIGEKRLSCQEVKRLPAGERQRANNSTSRPEEKCEQAADVVWASEHIQQKVREPTRTHCFIIY
jgi:hypothetical protein